MCSRNLEVSCVDTHSRKLQVVHSNSWLEQHRQEKQRFQAN